MIPTIVELSEVIVALAGGTKVADLPAEQIKIVAWACSRTIRHPEQVQTLGDTQVPPGTMPPTEVGEDEE